MANPEKSSESGKNTWSLKGAGNGKPNYPKAPAGIEIRGGKVSGAGLVRDAKSGKLVVPERQT